MTISRARGSRPRPFRDHPFQRNFGGRLSWYHWIRIVAGAEGQRTSDWDDHLIELRGQEIRTDRGELLMVGPECSTD